MGESIEIAAADGHRLSAYRAVPEHSRGGLVVLQEIFGVNGHIRSVVESFAREGYLTLAPALVDRTRRGVELGYDQQGIETGRRLRDEVKPAGAQADIAAAVAAAGAAGRVGVIGYCWGGLQAWVAAAGPSGLACAVVYYPGGVLEHAHLEPRCPVLAHFGESDRLIDVDGARHLASTHRGVQVFVYRAGHGFNCDQRSSYEPTAASEARARTLDFLRQHLSP